MPGEYSSKLFNRYSMMLAGYAGRLARGQRMAPKVDYILIADANRPIDFSKKPRGPMLQAYPVGWPIEVDEPNGFSGTFETVHLLTDDGWLLFHEPQPYWTPLQRLIPFSDGGSKPHAIVGNWPVGGFDWDDENAVWAAIQQDHRNREDPAYVRRIVERCRRGQLF